MQTHTEKNKRLKEIQSIYLEIRKSWILLLQEDILLS